MAPLIARAEDVSNSAEAVLRNGRFTGFTLARHKTKELLCDPIAPKPGVICCQSGCPHLRPEPFIVKNRYKPHRARSYIVGIPEPPFRAVGQDFGNTTDGGRQHGKSSRKRLNQYYRQILHLRGMHVYPVAVQ